MTLGKQSFIFALSIKARVPVLDPGFLTTASTRQLDSTRADTLHCFLYTARRGIGASLNDWVEINPCDAVDSLEDALVKLSEDSFDGALEKLLEDSIEEVLE